MEGKSKIFPGIMQKAASHMLQASSLKPQATSYKPQATLSIFNFQFSA
jgi:hypothetical protein